MPRPCTQQQTAAGALALVPLLLCPSCVGVQLGGLYDYKQRRLEPVVGVFVEGFGGLNTRKTSYGARSGAETHRFRSARFWLQPEVNLPLGSPLWNLSIAAGAEAKPWAVRTTSCYRNLDAFSYGACGHWSSAGTVSVDLNASLFVALLGADFSRVH